MKVLHLHDCAGIGALLCHDRPQDKILYRKQYDPYGIDSYYGFKPLRFDNSKWFKSQYLRHRKNFDVVVIHSDYELLNEIASMNYDHKTLVFYCHGGPFRNADRHIEIKTPYRVVSTPDLQEYVKDAFWLPNPVDTNIFNDFGFNRKNKALVAVKFGREHMRGKIEQLAYEMLPYEQNLTVWNFNTEFIAYHLVAGFLNQFKYFLDIPHSKTQVNIKAHSTLGLQAMACGCNVISSFDKIRDHLPKEHRLEYVKEEWELYLEGII